MRRRPPRPTHFPYTTLFRSGVGEELGRAPARREAHDAPVLHAGVEAPFAVNRDALGRVPGLAAEDRKSTRLNSSHANISYAVFCLKKKKSATFKFAHCMSTD